MSDNRFKTYSFDEDGFDFDKVPHSWMLYASALLCALGFVCYLFLSDISVKIIFMFVFLCKGILEILFTTLNQVRLTGRVTIFNSFYFAGIIDLLAFAAFALSMYIELPARLNIITIWLIAQCAWSCYISSQNELIRAKNFLHGLSVFTLSYSLVFFIWADSFIFLATGLLLYTIIRLTIAPVYRKKTSRRIKQYKTVRFPGEPSIINK